MENPFYHSYHDIFIPKATSHIHMENDGLSTRNFIVEFNHKECKFKRLISVFRIHKEKIASIKTFLSRTKA